MKEAKLEKIGHGEEKEALWPTIFEKIMVGRKLEKKS